jgi:N utilization substance protein A
MKLSMQQIELLNVLESRTGAQGKDVVLLDDGKIVFMVPKAELGRAVGRGGANVERLAQAVGKPVDIVEYSEDEQEFVKGLFAPVQPDSIEVRDGTVFVRFQTADKGRAIGRGGEKAARARTLLERYCNLKLKIL